MIKGTLESRVSKTQLLDYCLTEELIEGLPKGYIKRVSGRLLDYSNVTLSDRAIFARAKKLNRGEDIFHPAADIDGQPTFREGKDRCYEGFWTLIETELPNPKKRHYVGLVSNQIDVVRNKVKSPITVCERNKQKAKKLEVLGSFLERDSKGSIKVLCSDIFKTIKENRFNIFDLDLMCSMPNYSEIDSWVNSLWNSAIPGINLIYIVTSIGRTITEREYDLRSDYFHYRLVSSGFRNAKCSRFKHQDRQTPMRGERIVLTK